VILIDTSVLSRVFRRARPGPQELRLRATVEELMASDTELGLPGVVVQEVLSGVKTDAQFAELHHRLVSAFTIVHAVTDHYVDAARLKNTCLRKGVNVSGPDCLIATLAMAHKAELVALDDDFTSIAKHSTLRLRPLGAG
jgi:hypothetical protein